MTVKEQVKQARGAALKIASASTLAKNSALERVAHDLDKNRDEILKKNFPDDEQTWISALWISVAGHDAVRLEETIDEINRRKIDWSLSGKEQISTWVQV